MELPKFKLFWKYPEYWANKKPEFPIIRFKKKVITAKELNEKSDKLAMAFLDMGVKKGDTVVTVLPTVPPRQQVSGLTCVGTAGSSQ